MLVSEFTKLTGYIPTNEEYCVIELNYNLSTLNKYEFCADWCKQNPQKAGLLEKQMKRNAFVSAQKEKTINRVIRFVRTFDVAANLDDNTFAKVVKNINREISRSEIKHIKEYHGITQNWSFENWKNYWKLFNHVCYGN